MSTSQGFGCFMFGLMFLGLFDTSRSRKNETIITPNNDQICVKDGSVQYVYVNQDCTPFVVQINRANGLTIDTRVEVLKVGYDGDKFNVEELLPSLNDEIIIPPEPIMPPKPIEVIK